MEFSHLPKLMNFFNTKLCMIVVATKVDGILVEITPIVLGIVSVVFNITTKIKLV
jgi:hypothetical protein